MTINFRNFISKTLKFKFCFTILKVLFSRILLRMFSIGLRVPKWHLNATFQARKYKSKVIKISNMYESNFVVEVGCGVGEILGRVNAPHKFGIDLDKDTLLLCKRLNNKIKTFQLDIMINQQKLLEIINLIDKEETVLIIMVNWLHAYSEKKVKKTIENLLSLNRKIIIIADIYKRGELSRIKNNKIVHKFKDMNNYISYKEIKNIDSVRDLAILSN